MCGIAGAFCPEGGPPGVDISAMISAIAHRGPDGEGVWMDGPVAMGHRRLAILDLSPAAAQPMLSECGRFALIYNGEIYNHDELKRELIDLGYVFRSRSDTEVLLIALLCWGERVVNRLNGMFAFALWDCREKTLLLGRDRYGIKPLYVAWSGSTFLFGSEIKALLASGVLSAELDREGLTEYFTFQNFFTERTLFRNVHLMPAGHTLRLSADSQPGMFRFNQYWDFLFAEPTSNNRAQTEIADELDHLFEQAVKRQLVADVDIGAYLSGGADSGSITAIAARMLPNLRSYTVGFDLRSASGIEMAFDERASAEYMSYLFRTEHYEMVLKSGDMERSLPSVVRYLEEPRVGQSYPNYFAAKLASRSEKVVLSGTGGDELFGGYPWRYYRATQSSDFPSYIDNYYSYWQRLLPQGIAQKFFAPIWGEAKSVDAREIFRGVFRNNVGPLDRPEDYINHSLYFECKTFLHGLLSVEDKLSMAFGLETRVPFLDNDLVEFAMRLPVRYKLANLGALNFRLNENISGRKNDIFFQRTHDGKLLLREVLGRYVPEEVRSAAKQGFSAPDASWFRGESIDYVRRLLLEGPQRYAEFLDKDTVCSLVNEHLSGTENRRLLIWSLIYFERWCREFL
ncbi:MAG: asparagine synthase (glutamine-hydrolyzing) [Alphaproteobacteria bacterium]|nr:asparagine synthase (glutamine-hydrolyzing) [Alphaproteobacteria bacterium]